MTFGAWLQDQLIRRDMTQADLGRRLGVKSGTVSKWIGDAMDPSPRAILQIARVLGLPPEDVLLAVAEEGAAEEMPAALPSLPPNLVLPEAELVSRIAWTIRHWREEQESADEADVQRAAE